MDISAAIATISADMVIVLVLFVALGIFSFGAGGSRVVALALAFPLTLITFSLVSSALFLGSFLEGQENALLYDLVTFGFLLAFFYVISLFVLGNPLEDDNFLKAFLIGAATTTLLVALWQYVPHAEEVWVFGGWAQTFFSSAATLWWVLGMFGVLGFARRFL